MKKQIGIGTFSFGFFLMAIFWNLYDKEFQTTCFGDIVLQTLGLKTWSKGNMGIHYTIFYTFIFLIPSILISFKYPHDFLSKAGRIG